LGGFSALDTVFAAPVGGNGKTGVKRGSAAGTSIRCGVYS
jgi:hypothetical protein